MIHDTGINCRLPQTPRTPGTGASHYFDDVFGRHVPAATAHTPRPGNLRRSSTSRSIAKRSDFEYDDEDENVLSRKNSVGDYDPERDQERKEADAHVAKYVSEQLSKVRSNESLDFSNDEFEAQLDERR